MNRTRRAQFKRQIAASFGTKVSGYADSAVIQHKLLDRLIPYLINYSTPEGVWIDAGCGNGALEQKLIVAGFTGMVIGLDFALGSVQYCRKRFSGYRHWVCTDSECPPFKQQSVSGVISTSVLQWSSQMDHALHSLSGLLRREGIFAFSIFTDTSFKELAEVRKHFAIPQPIICPSLEELLTMLRKCNLSCIEYELFRETLFFPSAMDLLRHLSNSGSTSTSVQMPRKKLKLFCLHFEERFRTEQGIPLTYEAVIGICKKGGHNE